MSCGIDVAFSQEFSTRYPYQRVFKGLELDLLMARHNITVSQAAYLAWSATESLVKSLGIGFNLLDPRDMFVMDNQPYDKDLQINFAFVAQAIALLRLPAQPVRHFAESLHPYCVALHSLD